MWPIENQSLNYLDLIQIKFCLTLLQFRDIKKIGPFYFCIITGI